ncbi:MAG: hypothetical protein A2087_14690 [Spirochaetes bacterium GWD1_61_31]|nr:MAG: hypothetical protein A2Y37_09360 [Spirochaetes bacterium GWB1_60_80]OHD29180.1 MAG: hypothetical protein A2004_05710 [Spirochaetes bacterium GWC1_61_12]OHD35023.1 MAG: hypothetical protein A2087_14690 [Spirochaetes bacterium GWD1_61_31]OHD44029.1 MAG: hypothetical protein A2Y35_01690 [Spirochaetes bacterium GWE1_60_18]OHD59064.1 MAG: hypothetical protein A2Y32_02410 [Spirochaetes bacterium GWF1_60_12]HAP42595.1 hypothetical protein [Spirochaetaceae bacterium]
MLPTSLSFWLSRASAVIVPIYLYAAYRSLRLNPRGTANRLSALFNAVFAVWAGAAVFWYSAESASQADSWYRAFSWTWCLFPPLVLHFNLTISGSSLRKRRWLRYLVLVAIYAPAALLIYLTPTRILSTPVYRLGHWMLTVNYAWPYYFFVAHFILYSLIGILAVNFARVKSRNGNERSRLAVIVATLILAISFGFLTDGIFIMTQADVPNLAIFWALIVSLGLLMAINRFGFLSPLPIAETPRILNALADIVVFLDSTGSIAWANKSALESAGLTNLEAVKGKGIDLFVDEADARSIGDTARGLIDFYTGRSHWGQRRLPVSLRSRAIVDLNQVQGAIVTALDMSTAFALEKAEQTAADSGLLFNEFIEHSLDGIILTDADGNITVWNAPMVSQTGLATSEVLGTKIWDTMARLLPANKRNQQDSIGLKRSIITAMLGSSSPWTSKIIEQPITRTDGEERILQSSSFIIPLRTGAISATIIRDITESRRASEEMIERIRKLDHAQKMDAVGSLSGGIAHDFNNTLGGIVGAISLIKMGVEDGTYTKLSDIEKEISIIDRSAARASASVARLLALTKKRLPENNIFKFKEALKRVCDFAMRGMDNAVLIEFPKNSREAYINGDPGLIEQMLLNLFINAEHAMTIMRPKGQKRGGHIVVGLERFKPTQNFLAINPAARKQDYWCVSIQDEGVGIPHHILPHIFNPFYSTKNSEKSNGLGLSMVHSIVAQHGGFVDVASQLNKGSTFFIYLPAADIADAKTSQRQQILRGTGSILLVDDDEVVRDTGMAMLGALGYSSEAAVSGEEAIELFKQEPERWAAVIMDLRMNGMSGDEATMILRGIRSDLPVILASGFASEEAIRLSEDQPAMTFIQKPYSINTLSLALMEVQGKGSAGNSTR